MQNTPLSTYERCAPGNVATFWDVYVTEFRKTCAMVAESAARAMSAGFVGPTSTAIIDVDETLVCNLPTVFRDAPDIDWDALFSRAGMIPASHCPAGINAPLPGATEMIAAIISAKIHPIFVTGRSAAWREKTVENIKLLGLDAPVVFCCGGAASAAAGKKTIFSAIAKTRDVVMMIGDQAGDFTSGDSRDYAAFYMPNPFYRCAPQ